MKRILVLVVVFLFCLFSVSAEAAPTVDLTSGGSGWIGGVYYLWTPEQPTGTGVIDSFVRIAGNTDWIQGYNTDARPLEFDELSSPEFTRSLLLSEIPMVNLSGTLYREFLLDINQTGTEPLLSLDQLEIYVGDSPAPIGYPSGLGTLIYSMDAAADNWVLLDSSLNSGSGSGDMLMYVPNSLFSGGSYVTLFSGFGQNERNNDGHEEFAVLKVIPAPSSLLLCSIGSCFIGWIRRTRTLMA